MLGEIASERPLEPNDRVQQFDAERLQRIGVGFFRNSNSDDQQMTLG